MGDSGAEGGGYRFGPFLLDPADRRLTRDGAPVELSARYLDALALLVRESGRLVSKDRFLEEVWRGVPVTDEALTQCVRTLRRQLGDDAARPQFIETVPKHGYRFIAAVEPVGSAAPIETPAPAAAAGTAWRRFLLLGLAGAGGGGVAGLFGGFFYGFAGALQPGMGGASALLVLLFINVALGLAGGAGVGFGAAAAALRAARFPAWTVASAGAGGLVVGACVKLLGLDAFQLLFGRSPGDITGAAEGALLGAAVGLGLWLGGRGAWPDPFRRTMAAAGAAGAGAGLLIALAGGRLMGGSLDSLASRFPESRLRLDSIGALFGESGLGPVSRAATGALEGLIFAACVAAALILARRNLA